MLVCHLRGVRHAGAGLDQGRSSTPPPARRAFLSRRGARGTPKASNSAVAEPAPAVADGSRIVVVGASAGGVDALMRVVGGLRPDIPAPVFVVLHVAPDARSMLAPILARSTPLAVEEATDGLPWKPGHVYVAIPDRHLLLEGKVMRVVYGPRTNRHRPGIDPLFRSAARDFGPGAIGVVLSGALDDGAAGLQAIKDRGGIALVQSPQDASFPSMPRAALATARVDYAMPAAELGGLVQRLARTPVDTSPPPLTERLRHETDADRGAPYDVQNIGEVSTFTCPECHGALWEATGEPILRFRCRVGHEYTAQGLITAHDTQLEAALWASVRALEESAGLSRRVAERLRPGSTVLARRLDDRAHASEEHAVRVRRVLESDRSSKAE